MQKVLILVAYRNKELQVVHAQKEHAGFLNGLFENLGPLWPRKPYTRKDYPQAKGQTYGLAYNQAYGLAYGQTKGQRLHVFFEDAFQLGQRVPNWSMFAAFLTSEKRTIANGFGRT